ncbi:phage tail protein [Salmonella enterica]
MKLYNLASAGFFIAKNPGGKMALSLLAANNAQAVLAAGISSTTTSLTVNTGTGTLFPSPVAGTSFFKLTIIDAATGTLTEIVHVTARNGDVFTIQRGQEGTVARAWSANDIAANMMTAGTLSYILGNFQSLDPTLTALAALVGVANKLPYFNGNDTAALTDLTQAGRDIIGKSTIADILTYLGIYDASTSQKGLVRLNGGVTDDDNTLAATSAAVKIAYDAAVSKWTAVDATTSVKGIVQLNTSTNSTSTTQAATPSAVKSVYDLANGKWTPVDGTTFQKGIVRLNGGVTDEDDTVAATSGAVKIAYDAATAPALGKGQILQDLRGSRSIDATYTNSTGFPIAVYVRISGGYSANLYVHVNGIEFGGGGSAASNTSIATAFFIVPNGATYRVTASGVSLALQMWSELR